MAKKNKVKKPAVNPIVKPNDIHPCDPGWTWSELQQKCVKNIG